jgi:hypothetical protein
LSSDSASEAKARNAELEAAKLLISVFSLALNRSVNKQASP